MSDLRECAELVRRVCAGESYQYVYQTVGMDAAMVKYVRDCEVLARQYVADHPHDDDVTIDDAWLYSVGFETVDYSENGVSSIIIETPIGHDCYSVWVSRIPDGQWYYGSSLNDRFDDSMDTPIKMPFTRGDLRRLCAALGIELKEQK